ncbi:gamma-glutamyltransferase family protein [Brevundimonas sp.]|uniref:gamma-glutamyltransferase family protein n=1 Tax=Brevundimonas sp. TaxID=1871086 RepID=UPI001D839FBC|nr:gamma-glutamyltransferase family protein [Brevundimonas sp.]MBA4000708.1 gamma-glutamyltransferase [Brevundimonas sp.]
MTLSPSLRRRAARLLAPVLSTALILAGCAAPMRISAEPAPVAAQVPSQGARGPIVSAANPLAAEAGMAVLRRGGSAVDAAVAVQAVLGLVEPQSSGLGGGAFLMHYDAATGAVTAFDGRETAPSAATPELFFEDGEPLGFREAVLSGRSTGAPGAVAMLAMAHERHGRLDWSGLFGDAARLAEDGFTVSPRLAGMIASSAPQASTAWARAYFSGADGERLEAGDTLRNPAYAATVRALAEDGPDALYSGPIAAEIIETVRAGERPGALSLEDLAAYTPVAREAVCREWRVYVVCVPPPPSSGLAVLQLLAMAEHVPAVDGGPADAEAWTAFARLQSLMYADRDRYVGDADFVEVPVAGLLDPAYVARRAALTATLDGAAEPGLPPGFQPRAADATAEPSGTSHFVVVDADGNAVSMTTTVESLFGSGRMAAGFFLNNQLTDFSFSPADAAGRPVANAVAPGKRPRSSMSPVIILDREGRFVGAVGSPGGTSILAYVAKALIGTLAWDLSMQEAIDLPNLVARGDGFGADTELFSPELRAELAAAGIALRPNASENSGLHGVLWRDGRWDAGADPRREGVVLSR